MRSFWKVTISLTTALLSLILGSQAVFAEEEITISLSPDSATLSLLPGNFGFVNQTISVSSTSLAGYNIKLRTLSASLVHQDDETLSIPTFSLPEGASSLPAESTGYGYGYSIDSGQNYYPAPGPNTSGKQIFKTNEPGQYQHTITFGAKVPTNTISGIYSNTFIFFVVANLDPCPANSICYYGNNDDGTGTMANQPASSNTEVTLMASNYSRPGYGFVGWNTELDGSGTTYGPSQTIETDDLSAVGLQLYAKWIPSSGNLQLWHGCESMNIGDITALTDARDGSTYAVAKYPDEQCWMMENLRLDLSDPKIEISAINTNNPTATFTTAVNTHPSSTNSFCTANGSGCADQILFNTNNTNRSLTAAYDTNDTSSSWYSYGNYYNWYTATAGNGTYAMSIGGSATDGDLCPAGWRLPTGYGSNGDLSQLDKKLGGTGINQESGNAGIAASKRWRSFPLNYIYSGEQNGASAYNRNVSGSYNTSNTTNNQRSVNLWVRPSAVNVLSNSTLKTRGQTIRCVAKEHYSATGNIHYDGNGGVGTMADAENVDLATATAANNEFTKPNSVFVSWNTKANGSGITVAEGGLVVNAASEMGITEGETLTLYAIWKSVYRIIYAGNNADAGAMTVSHDDVTGDVGLIAPNFSRVGYGFAGWSLDPNAGTKIQNHETVTVYGPNQVIRLDSAFLAAADANNNISLYATWLPADTTYTLQTFDSTQCNAMATNDILALTDERDNNTYAVAKLADGNCWMVENLRLNPSTTAFTSANTNNPTASFINEAAQSSDSNTLCNTNDSACIDQVLFNGNNINRALNASPTSNNANSWYGYGMMYGWYTATSGNGTFAMTSGNVVGDICPAGWRLPIGGNSGEFVSLNSALNNASSSTDAGLLKFPGNFIYSGDYNFNKPGGRGTYGRYWSATPNGQNNAYRLGVAPGGATPAGSWNKWDAFAVRCILK